MPSRGSVRGSTLVHLYHGQATLCHHCLPHPLFRNFYESQFRFLAPVFRKDRFVHILRPGHPWPITTLDAVSSQGYFGTVRKARLRADHQETDLQVLDALPDAFRIL